jgi:hypothetical protein
MGFLDDKYDHHTRWREECGERFGTVFDLPVLKPIREIRRLVANTPLSVLDFGAGKKQSAREIYRIPSDRYQALDSDLEYKSSYKSLDDIKKDMRFGLVIMDQVIEHVSVNECYSLISRLSESLTPQGFVSITVPNMAHPVRYWADCDHMTPWSFYDIYGLLRNNSLEVRKIGRFNKFSLGFGPLNHLFARKMRKVFRIDWCDSIWVLGQTKARHD